jgi:hypothetical protein
MTDMAGTQARVTAATSITDEELIGLLVPPPRPRWQTVCIAVAFVLVLAGVVLLSESGAVVPRVHAELWQWGPNDRAFTVGFRLRNDSWTQTQVRAVDASQSMFGAAHVLTPLPQTLDAHSTLEVTVRFDSFNCGGSVDGRSSAIRVRVRDPFGLTLTRRVRIDTHDGAQGSWPAYVTADACAAKRG